MNNPPHSIQWTSTNAPILSIVNGYSSQERVKKLLLMLQAYIDDSACDSGARRLFLAGFINTSEKWERFSDAWQDELDASPRIEYLKMSEARALQGQFRGITGPQRDEKLRGFYRVIRHFKPASVHCSVSRTEIDEIIKPIAPSGLASPYLHCFEGLIVPLAQHQAELGETIPIDFIFDEQEGLGENARTIYRLVREFLPSDVRALLSVDPIFCDDKKVLPLQAADVLAWHLRRQFEDGIDYEYPPSHLTQQRSIHAGVNIPKEYLERIATGLKNIPNVELLNSKSAWKTAVKATEQALASGAFPPPRKSFFQRVLKRFTHVIRR